VWGYVKDKVLFHLFLQVWKIYGDITAAVASKDADMIDRFWNEIAYRWDICRVTRGNHVELL
jgi:hypothetical protein